MGEDLNDDVRKLPTSRVLTAWAAVAMLTFFAFHLMVCEFLVSAIGPWYAPEALLTTAIDGPPPFRLAELLCGPLWWLLPGIVATVSLPSISRTLGGS